MLLYLQHNKMSKVYSLRTVQKIPVSINVAWDFFSNPKNLADITPGNMGFHIISRHHGEKMYPGQLIEYTVRPVFNIPLYWMTEITHVDVDPNDDMETNEAAYAELVEFVRVGVQLLYEHLQPLREPLLPRTREVLH